MEMFENSRYGNGLKTTCGSCLQKINIQNTFEENPDVTLNISWNEGKGDFSTSSCALNGPFNKIETHLEAFENLNVSHITKLILIHDCNLEVKFEISTLVKMWKHGD